jgi:hypothetical protein
MLNINCECRRIVGRRRHHTDCFAKTGERPASMMTQTMSFSLEHTSRTPVSSGEASVSNGAEQVTQSLAEQAEASSVVAADGSRPEPTRGVKKTTSLRRGAAGYDQLLQSAVMASIESRRDAGGSVAPPLPADNSMQVENDAAVSSSSRGNKRTRHQEIQGASAVTPRKSLTRRDRDSSDMDCC